MRTTKQEDGTTKLWLSASDTWEWAHRSGAHWPCSEVQGLDLYAEFDGNGDLVDLATNGRGSGGWSSTHNSIPGDEFRAITSDFLRERYGPDHPAIRGDT